MSVISESELRELIQLMHILPHKRSVREIAQIARLISNVSFFSNYQEAVKEACCRLMKYAEYPAGSFVFRKGDPGDSFCIILRGKVGVLIPATALSTPTLAMARRQSTRGLEPQNKKNALLSRALFAVKTLKAFKKEEKDEQKDSSLPKAPQDEENGQVEVSELGPGKCFGELALLQDSARSASILCKAPTILAILTKGNFNLVLKEEQARRLNEKISFIHAMPAFQSWSRLDLSKLTYYLKEKTYKRWNRVYEEGEAAEEAYIVLEGQFRLTKAWKVEGQGRYSSQLQLVIKGQGELFGESDLLSDQSRALTCTCESTTGRLWCIGKFDFLRRVQNAETWSYIYRKTEVQKRWLTARMDALLDVETFKSQPSTDLPKPQLDLSPVEVTGLKRKLKTFSNTVLARQRMVQTDRGEGRKVESGSGSREGWSREVTQRSATRMGIYIRKMRKGAGLKGGQGKAESGNSSPVAERKSSHRT